jgi:predicted flap endonuclease-1-like 5' DNA nuclease
MLVMLALTAVTGCAKTAAPTVARTTAAAELEAERAYAIETVLGIGPAYGAKLKEAKITNTNKLLEATSTRYKRQQLAEQTGIPYKLVLQFAQKVAIMSIGGIGPRQSNLLAAVGVDSVQDLARRDPANLWERVGIANAFEPKFVGHTPSLETVTKWVAEAKKIAHKTDSEE